MLTNLSSDSHDNLLLDLKHRRILEKIAKKYVQGTTVHWEDAVQTGYIKVLEAVKAGRFRHGGTEDFYRWATVVARYEIIDFVRKESRRQFQSLDSFIPGTDIPILDNISDESLSFDAVERADFALQVMKAVEKLNVRYPERGYLKLWQGLVRGTKQTQLALILGVTQPEVSRRRKELALRVVIELGLLPPNSNQNQNQKQLRRRSQSSWT
jgi:RNA polymerase sigma factor (sigma-70 family)